MTPSVVLLALALLPTIGPAGAAEVLTADYDDLARRLTRRVDFERLPHRAEPGINFDRPIFASGAWLGERFEGQTTLRAEFGSGPGHDRIAGRPQPPVLRILAGAPQQNLSVAFHRGFGSNALFPLGPAGFPAITARGEGALAILFDSDQAELGFRLHADYPAPLGTKGPRPGTVEVRFFARDGTLIAQLSQPLTQGVMGFGFVRTGGLRDIAGILIVNRDPGGIAVDDIIFANALPLG